MIDLALSVLFTSLLFIVFKLFELYKVQTLFAIISNYFTAALVGTFFFESDIHVYEAPQKPWFWGTFALGAFFIVIFNIMAKSSQKLGVSVTSIASKMSLVIPVVVGIWMYNESLSPLQIAGVILALVAVYFASLKTNTSGFDKSSLWLPALVFVGSGIIDVALKYFQEKHVPIAEFPLFSSTVFLSAGSIGLLYVLIRVAKTGFKINLKNVFWGMLLGIPNYFTVHFLLRALNNPALNSATVFTINNVAVVLFTTLLGIILFKERLSTKNWAGLILAVTSIIMVALF